MTERNYAFFFPWGWGGGTISTVSNPVGKSTGWLLAAPDWPHSSDVLMENPKEDAEDPAHQGSASPLPLLSLAAALAGRIATADAR